MAREAAERRRTHAHHPLLRHQARAHWDNFHKLSMDALNGIAYEDDSQIKQVTVAMAYDKQKLRMRLRLRR